MIVTISLIIIALIISLTSVYIYKNYINMLHIILKKDKWDAFLDETINFTYNVIYTKYVLPYVSSGVTINVNKDDKHFLEMSTSFIKLIDKKLGRLKQDVYLKIYTNEEEFNDILLTIFITKIQSDIMETVINPSINNITGNNQMSDLTDYINTQSNSHN